MLPLNEDGIELMHQMLGDLLLKCSYHSLMDVGLFLCSRGGVPDIHTGV